MKILQIVQTNSNTLDTTLPFLWYLKKTDPNFQITILYCVTNKKQILRKANFVNSFCLENGIQQIDLTDLINAPKWLKNSLRFFFQINNKVGFIELLLEPKPGSVIFAKHIENQLEAMDPAIDVLLLKTNFEKHRGKDIYWNENLGFDPELAPLFRQRFKSLKAFGFDSISLTSVKHREIGAKAHKNFLGEEQLILIIEDMHLSKLSNTTNFKRLIVASFPVDNADGAPVNCLLETL